ncbi:MAG TPA: hypothetical protein V6C65_14290, partial [Allocoleopsis sp.]
YSFTAAGDVSIAYDLAFTNPDASYIKSNAPLYLEAGPAYSSNDLTLRTYNSGNVVVNTTTLDVEGNIQLNLDSGASHDAAVCHGTSNSSTVDQTLSDCSSTPASDYMEMYPVDNDVEMGDLVSIGDEEVIAENGTRIKKLTKSTGAYDKKVMGVHSDPEDQGDFNSIGYNIRAEDNPKPIALAGRVKVKVSSENGSIQPGDSITASSIPGVGMKATRAGIVVGQALEAYSNPDTAAVGLIMVFVKQTYFDPDVYLTSTGDLNIFSQGADPVSGEELFGVEDANNEIVTRMGVFSDVVMGNVRAGSIDAQTLTLAGENVAGRLSEIASTSATLSSRVDSIESRVSALESAGASGSGSLQLDDLTARVASLEAKTASQSGSSAVSLTDFNNLDLKVASLESSLAFQASQSAFFMDMVVNNPLLSFTASSGAELGLDKLDVNTATVSGALDVLGRATFQDVGITGTVNVGLLA